MSGEAMPAEHRLVLKDFHRLVGAQLIATALLRHCSNEGLYSVTQLLTVLLGTTTGVYAQCTYIVMHTHTGKCTYIHMYVHVHT